MPPLEHRSGSRRRGAERIGALLALSALTACATPARVESEPGPGAGLGAPVEVTLEEYRIRMPGTLPAGRLTLRIRNAGTLDHNLAIEGPGVSRDLPTDLRPGETQTLTVSLVPGEYDVYCPIGDHEERGMWLQVRVGR